MGSFKQCDRCGYIFPIGGITNIYVDGKDFFHCDLCKSCREKLKGWLKNNGE